MKFLSGVGGALAREVGRLREYPILVIFGVFLPLLTILFMYFLFEDGVPRSLPIAFCDQDNTQLSRAVERAINATPSARIQFHVQNPAEGKQLIQERKAYALVVIPRHFQKDVQRGEAPAVIDYYNNIYLLPGSLLYKDILSAVGTISMTVKASKLVQSGIMAAKVKNFALPVEVVVQRLFNPYTNYQYYLAGGFMPTVFQMFVILSFILALGFELKEGTAREWLDAAHGDVVAALVGKMIPYLICSMIIGIFMVTLLLRFADIPLEGESSAIFVALFLFIVASMMVSIVITAILANLRFALSIGAFYTAIAFTFSGLTFPSIAMPAYVRYIGEFIPLTHYIRIFIGQSLRGAPVVSNLPSFALLILFFIPALLVLPRWHRLMREERFWGGI